MRGIKSFGMVLCVRRAFLSGGTRSDQSGRIVYQATSKSGKEGGIEIVDPPKGSKPGDRIYFEGEQYESM